MRAAETITGGAVRVVVVGGIGGVMVEEGVIGGVMVVEVVIGGVMGEEEVVSVAAGMAWEGVEMEVGVDLAEMITGIYMQN